MAERLRRRSVSPRPVHALAASVSAPQPAGLRCPQPRGMHGRPAALEHALASARAAQRSDLCRSGPRVCRADRPPRAAPPAERLDHAPFAGRCAPACDPAESETLRRTAGQAASPLQARWPAAATELLSVGARPRRFAISTRPNWPPGQRSPERFSICTPPSTTELIAMQLSSSLPGNSPRRALSGTRGPRRWGRWPCRLCSIRPASPARRPPTPPRPVRRPVAGPGWSTRGTSCRKAKRVIWLYMAGGMSHLETFDHKPKLAELHGQPMPESITKGQQIAQIQGQKLNCFAPQHPFKKYGQSGPRDQQHLSALRRASRRRNVHRPLAAHRGDQSRSGPHVHEHRLDDRRPPGRRLLAAIWIGKRNGRAARASSSWSRPASSGKRSRSRPGNGIPVFCPASFRESSSAARAIPCCTSATPRGSTSSGSGTWSTPCKSSTDIENASVDDPEIATRISQYEMAFRMQSSVPGLMDVHDEPQHVLDLYGTKGGDGTFASQLPVGPAAGRARRALHPTLPPRLGSSRLGQGPFRRHRGRSRSRRRRRWFPISSSGACSTTR